MFGKKAKNCSSSTGKVLLHHHILHLLIPVYSSFYRICLIKKISEKLQKAFKAVLY